MSKRYIPNALTFGNLFCGFLSLGYIINQDIRNATILIFIAMMLDALDGRAARILGVSNDFGKELDSLADIVSFGIAPAFLAIYTYFVDYGMAGMVIAGVFPLFGAYRLARFNLTSTNEPSKYFRGIPITFAGGLVAFLVLFYKVIPVPIFAVIYFVLGILMASSFKIPSFKDIPLPKYSFLVTIFLLYMTYLITKSKNVPIFFYVALGTYILFILLRFVKEKEIKFPKRRFKLPNRKFRLRKRK
ncbi:CDP-diacylglycerol--serine O-phosphatidyltransferase [Bacillus luteolus]|uniref:CDP-diacylglycerol--serine O-phosphatidyltransferase n=1 Tax=Litchfieldia luteola TaxID=682179 RepID=A0ABR9QIL6_9BACI|nr:CDP-diacylglycerol--serine O-phosphatidyltransferase [Cytobacillus luteolus]MBE4908347.1 CDP-diacylglycerol--serine O-phosphatidyltransferase [Cytobacillus luteolus]MBP1943135.1 CDP-diacylglycerol--serine O-phosphatidyltransferase [Cytobacillus luteolus]